MTENSHTRKLRAALYLRVSTDEQAKEGHYGLEIQEERGRSFCQSQEYKLDAENIFKDDISGGLPIEKRPALSKLFEAAQRKEFDVVVVYKIDRLARNQRILLNALHDLENYGIFFRSITEPFDTTTSFGEATMQLFGTFAQLEKGMIRERTMNGKTKAMQTGKWVAGIAPYGYEVDPVTRKLVKKKSEAPAVEKIFGLLVDERMSLYQIEKRMNELKIPAPYSTKISKRDTQNRWYKRTIGRILTNEVYTGTFYYRKYKRPFNNLTSITGKSGLRPQEDWIEIQTPAIISKEMYEAAKAQLTRNREFATRNKKREYLYSKLIYCSECGFKMFGGFKAPKIEWEHGNGRYYHGIYRNAKTAGSKRCEWCPRYSEPRMEPIWESLKEILQNPKNMLAPLEKYVYKSDDPKRTKERLDEIDEQLNAIQRKRSKAYDLLINESITDDQCQQYVKEYERDQQALNNEATRLRQKLLTKQEKVDREQAVRKACEQVQQKLDNVSYEDKAKIISFFIERITLHAKQDYAEVVFSFPHLTDTKREKIVSLSGKTFPLVLNIKTVSEAERRSFLIRANPGMYVPKALV